LLPVLQEGIMAVDERSRHELYRRLEEVLGTEAATTLIEHLPPVAWADVVTKHDLAALEQRMELRFARVDDRFARIDDRFALIDDRFARMEEQFARIDDRFDRMEERFNGLEERFNGLGWRFDGANDRIKAATSICGPPSSTSCAPRPPPWCSGW